jgi:hypothetical protein
LKNFDAFEQYLAENAPFHQNGKLKAFFTSHSTQRSVERAEFMSINDFKILIDRIADWIRTNHTKVMDKEEFLAFSKSMNRGIIFAYRKDRFDTSDRRKHIYIMTVLPEGRSNPKPGTPKIVLESYQDSQFSTEFCNYVAYLLPPNELLESAGNSESVDNIEIDDNFWAYFVNGQLYSTNLHVIEV